MASLVGVDEQTAYAAVRAVVVQKVQEAAGVTVGAEDDLLENGVEPLESA